MVAALWVVPSILSTFLERDGSLEMRFCAQGCRVNIICKLQQLLSCLLPMTQVLPFADISGCEVPK